MRLIYTDIKLRNPMNGLPAVEIKAKADTGATMLVIPGAIAEKFRFPLLRKQVVKYANEEVAERDVVWGVEIELCGRKGVFEAVVEPKKEYVLVGAVVMESLDLLASPSNRSVYPDPRSTQPMAEIE
jgi:predicted aspartyl protease